MIVNSILISPFRTIGECPLSQAQFAEMVFLSFVFSAPLVHLAGRQGRTLQPCPQSRFPILLRPIQHHLHFTLKTLPPAACAASPVTPSLTEGTIVQINTSNRSRLARLIRPDGKRNWIVEDVAKLNLSVSPKQIAYILGHPDEAPSLSHDLLKIQSIAESLAAECVDLLETAWEMISSGEGIDGSNTTTISQLSGFLLDDTSSLSQYATYLVLLSDATFFKGKVIKGILFYEARTSSQVLEVRLLEETRKAKEKEESEQRDALLDAYLRVDEKSFRAALGPNNDDIINVLKSIALELDGNPAIDNRYASFTRSAFHQLSASTKAAVQNVFSALALPLTPSSALTVLIKLNIFTKHENLSLRGAVVPHRKPFDAEVTTAINQLLSTGVDDVDNERRIDLSHLTAIAIDSADTSEVDDAFSWDVDSGRIYVHIADPSRYFPNGYYDIIVQEAMRRVATLYLPYTKLTMFPEDIAVNLMSLCGNRSDGSALTFSFKITDSGNLSEDMDIHLSRISTPVRLTYEDAEESLNDESKDHHEILNALLRQMNRRRDWREFEGGAIIVTSPLHDITVKHPESDEPEIQVKLVQTDTSAWLLVSELMISACVVAASLAEKHGLAVPFRGQEPFEYPSDGVLESVPDGPARASLAFRNAGPSGIGITPKEHASLGLDAYVQATSPIRRSLDFLTHLQLKTWLREGRNGEMEGGLSKEVVLQEISRAQTVSRTLRGVESRTNRYWMLEMLRRNGKAAIYRGVYIREVKERIGIIHLDDFAFTISADLNSACKPGDVVDVSILSVNVRGGTVQAVARRLVQNDGCENGHENNGDIDWDTEMEDALSDISSQSLDDAVI